MEIRDLKNYGKPMSETIHSIPKKEKKELTAMGFKIIKKHLSLFNLIRFGFLSIIEKRRMLKKDLSSVREKGLSDEEFIRTQINFAADFSAMSRIMGKEKTLEIFNEMMETIAPYSFIYASPRLEDYDSCGDRWKAFSEYMVSIADADNNAGCHFWEIVENTDRALEMNCTYCAWYEIPKQLGITEACLPACYGDDVFLPGALQLMGIKFIRNTTLARGGDYCDFRYERQMD